jgi:predicted metalloprotease with PDZ domain
VGDVLLAVDREEIKDFDSIATRIERLQPGATIKLRVTRDAKELEFDVTLGDRSKQAASPSRRLGESYRPDRIWRERSDFPLRDIQSIESWVRANQGPFAPDRALLGVQTQPVTEPLAKSLGLSSTDGALVNSVIPDSPADRAGIRSSDVVLGVDGEPVKSPVQLHERIQSAGPSAKVRLEIVRDGRKETVEATLAQRPLIIGPSSLDFSPRSPRVFMFPDQWAERMAALEERVKNMEKRIEELESRLQGRGADSAPPGDKR